MGENPRNVQNRGKSVAAGKELSVSQAVPLRPDDRQKLRVVAAQMDVGPGLLGRALILAGLDMLEDPRIQAALQAESEAQDMRQSAAGQAAMAARWHGEKPEPETPQAGE